MIYDWTRQVTGRGII